jgi:hypothetical protein
MNLNKNVLHIELDMNKIKSLEELSNFVKKSLFEETSIETEDDLECYLFNMVFSNK